METNATLTEASGEGRRDARPRKKGIKGNETTTARERHGVRVRARLHRIEASAELHHGLVFPRSSKKARCKLVFISLWF